MRVLGISGASRRRMEDAVAGTQEPGSRNHFMSQIRYMLTVVNVAVTGTNGMRIIVKNPCTAEDGLGYLGKIHLYYVMKNAESIYTRLEQQILECRLQLH